MTDALRLACIAAVAVPALAGLVAPLLGTPRAVQRLLVAAGAVGGAVGTGAGVWAMARGGQVVDGGWYRVDAPAGLFMLVIAVVGGVSAMLSPPYLARSVRSGSGALGSHRFYACAYLVFWAVLAAIPCIGNLGLAWLLLEGTTAASALLVAFTGSRQALEAGWKYLVLTSAGLSVALLGVVLLVVSGATRGDGLASLDFVHLGEGGSADIGLTRVALVLILVGVAAKAGWAPVHNWLPDAHSEAPPPVSALLSAATLPTVALVAWRVVDALAPVAGVGTVRTLMVGLGLASLAVAVPFLWRPMAWKRFLAYSSLEHMGVIAIGIGMQHRWAAAGVCIHVAAHAAAKALGFWTATPLLRYQPDAGRRSPRGLRNLDPTLAAGVVVSAGTLSGLPPSPLFASEMLILYSALVVGLPWVAVLMAVLLALGFVGIINVLVEAVPGRSVGRRPAVNAMLPLRAACWAVGAALAATALLAFAAPHSALATALLAGAA
ncbi:MAG: proton-conducting transporter membrane subunit [Thermoleophilia bacterium]